LDHPLNAKLTPSSFDYWPKALAQYEIAKENAPIHVRLGLELGAANHYPDFARKIASQPELDLVMGSVHNLYDTADFYFLKYENETQCMDMLDRYADELLEFAALDCFDVLSHIGYTRRYMQRDGFNIEFGLKHFGDKIDAVLKLLIQKGKGIELNCSYPLLDPEPTPTPLFDVLCLYKQLGGEIITVGSDSHRVSMAGKYIQWGHDVLRAAGFQYASLFDKRKPIFYTL